jgi:hypothetical protein
MAKSSGAIAAQKIGIKKALSPWVKALFFSHVLLPAEW